MKKFRLGELKLQSFITTLDEAKREMIRGGVPIGGGGPAGGSGSVTCPANPKTTETEVSTCTTEPSDTTGGNSCKKP